MKRVLLILVLILVVPALAADLPETVSEGLVLEARVDETTFRVGDSIKVTVVMRNESESPMLVVTNFGWETSEPVYFDGNDVLIPTNPPGDAAWSHVDFLTPFSQQYKQDHDFPQTLRIFAREYPYDTRDFENRRFWYEHLTCLAQGSEQDAWYCYRVSSLPSGLTEGNYEIRFRYQLNQWLLDEFKKHSARIVKDERLASCFNSVAGDGKDTAGDTLPLFRGLAVSNTLKIKVLRPENQN